MEGNNTHRFGLFLENSLNEILVFDNETLCFVDVNQRAMENLGYSLAEFQEMTLTGIYPEFGREGFVDLLARLRSGAKKKIVVTTTHRRKDESQYPVDVHLQLISEEPPVLVAIVLDITDRQQVEQKYRELVEGTIDLITQVDAAGNFLHCNHMGREIFGLNSDQLIGKSVFPFVHPDDRERTKTWFAGCLNKLLPKTTIENRQVNQETGTVHDLLWTVNFHYDEQGDLTFINSIGRDITELKKREEQSFLNEKLATIAGLAAGVAHEINTPLSGILQSHQLIEMGLSPDEEHSQEKAAECNVDLVAVQEYFKKNDLDFFMDGIRESALKASHIVKSLLEFSRPCDGSFSSADLKDIVDRALLLSHTDYDLKKRYGISKIKIVKEYAPDLPLLVCVATEIEQVIMSLVKNSAQALSEADMLKNSRITLRLAANDRNAVIEVADNGPGISREVAKHIFDPFFTTRDVGDGTGMGLAVAHTIVVDKHKGAIRVESEEGNGTTFVVELPRDPAA